MYALGAVLSTGAVVLGMWICSNTPSPVVTFTDTIAGMAGGLLIWFGALSTIGIIFADFERK